MTQPTAAAARALTRETLAEALKAVTRNVLYRGDKQGAQWRADTADAILAALPPSAPPALREHLPHGTCYECESNGHSCLAATPPAPSTADPYVAYPTRPDMQEAWEHGWRMASAPPALDVERLAEALYLLGIDDTDLEGSAEIATTIAAEYAREMHAVEGMATTCDACIYLPEVFARMERAESLLGNIVRASTLDDSSPFSEAIDAADAFLSGCAEGETDR